MNTLTRDDKEHIWIPQLLFVNTVLKSQSLSDDRSVVSVIRSPIYSPRVNSLQDLHNVELYDGKKNPLILTRVYTEQFICTYDMRTVMMIHISIICALISLDQLGESDIIFVLEPDCH